MKLTKDDKQFEEACYDNEKLARLLSGLISQRRTHYVLFWILLGIMFMELFGRWFFGDSKMHSNGFVPFFTLVYLGFALHADSKIKFLLCIKAGNNIGRTERCS